MVYSVDRSDDKNFVERSLKFAGIDVGSNAIRLLLARVFSDRERLIIKKESLIRMPIRLGDDAFRQNYISDTKIDQLVKTFKAFKLLIEAYQPVNYAACATSALRESENGSLIIKRIKKESQIPLRIIEGKEEAEIIFLNKLNQSFDDSLPFMYIDVGGGSTELTFMLGKEPEKSRSFPIGTIRLLENLVSDSEWKNMQQWIKDITKGYEDIRAIGSGGNINKIFRLSNRKEGKALPYKNLKEISKYLKSLSYLDRLTELRLRPDRADVIVPAAEIYLFVMKMAQISKIYVPQIGLADGLIHLQYRQYKKDQH
jgi:exopolyphosphatase/guanosine-5'-triphosphate,3'-diphosphate pyrophosphatase